MRNGDYHKKRSIKYVSQYLNEVDVEIRHAKSKFFREKINDCSRSSDPNTAWTLINSLLSKNSETSFCSELSVNDKKVSDPKAVAEAFNDYFVSIGPRLAAEYDEQLSNNSDQSLNENCHAFTPEKFKISKISVYNAVSTLQSQKACKSTGMDKIPAKILKLLASIISPSLTHIFNLSLTTGICVDDWKHARVTPIFKEGDRRLCENYCHITILPAVCKSV